MANTTTSGMSNSVRQQYRADYVQSALIQRLYDQLAVPVGQDMSNLKRGSQVNVPFLSSLPPATTVISEIADVTPVIFRDATVAITPTSRIAAILVSEKLMNTNYTTFNSSYYKKLGENMMLSVDLVALTAAVNGGFARSIVARSSLDAGTASHRLVKSTFINAGVMMQAMKVPDAQTPRGRRWFSIVHPFAFQDLMQDTVITAVGEYSKPDMIMNFELGELNGFSIAVNPWSKVFWGAGSANASVVNTTLSADVKALDTVINVTANTNIAVGGRIWVGPAVESSTTI